MPPTQAQIHESLQRAQHVHRRRGAVRRQLAAGDLHLAAAMVVPEVASMQIVDLITALPGWGTRRAETVLRGAGIFGQRSVRQLTQRQLDVITDLVDQAHARGLGRMELVA